MPCDSMSSKALDHEIMMNKEAWQLTPEAVTIVMKSHAIWQCMFTTQIDLGLCESVHMCMLASLSLRRHAHRSPTVCSLTV